MGHLEGADAPVSPARAAGARRGDVLQVSELHEGLVEVVQLQDAGEQEEAGDEDAGEELGHAELLQAQVPQPGEGGPSALPGPWVPQCRALGPKKRVAHAQTSPTCLSNCPPATHCSSVKPVRLRQYMGKSWNWKV